MIKLTNISKSFGSLVTQQVLRDLNFSLDEGKIHCVMGPSGSGKTTLLKTLGTLLTPESGTYYFNDIKPLELKGDALSNFRNKRIGFIFQNHQLLPQLTVLENVLLPTISHQGIDASPHAKALLKGLAIEKLENKYPKEISGGESQRVAIARALINQPELLLADEPTGALDQNLSLLFGKLLLQINKEFNVTMVVATHSDRLASQLGNVYHLKSGQIVKG